jgi:ATP-dependent DNA helicase HFM1/MER3
VFNVVFLRLDEGYRPVKVNKIVLGVYSPPDQNDYMFENNLAYKLGRVIETYSNNKPTLIV